MSENMFKQDLDSLWNRREELYKKKNDSDKRIIHEIIDEFHAKYQILNHEKNLESFLGNTINSETFIYSFVNDYGIDPGIFDNLFAKELINSKYGDHDCFVFLMNCGLHITPNDAQKFIDAIAECDYDDFMTLMEKYQFDFPSLNIPEQINEIKLEFFVRKGAIPNERSFDNSIWRDSEECINYHLDRDTPITQEILDASVTQQIARTLIANAAPPGLKYSFDILKRFTSRYDSIFSDKKDLETIKFILEFGFDKDRNDQYEDDKYRIAKYSLDTFRCSIEELLPIKFMMKNVNTDESFEMENMDVFVEKQKEVIDILRSYNVDEDVILQLIF